jgi:hypothetical protein
LSENNDFNFVRIRAETKAEDSIEGGHEEVIFNEADIIERLKRMTQYRRFEKRFFFNPSATKSQLICLSGKVNFMHLSRDEKVNELLEEKDHEERVSKYSTILGFSSGPSRNSGGNIVKRGDKAQTSTFGATLNVNPKNFAKKKEPIIVVSDDSKLD